MLEVKTEIMISVRYRSVSLLDHNIVDELKNEKIYLFIWMCSWQYQQLKRILIYLCKKLKDEILYYSKYLKKHRPVLSITILRDNTDEWLS